MIRLAAGGGTVLVAMALRTGIHAGGDHLPSPSPRLHTLTLQHQLVLRACNHDNINQTNHTVAVAWQMAH